MYSCSHSFRIASLERRVMKVLKKTQIHAVVLFLCIFPLEGFSNFPPADDVQSQVEYSTDRRSPAIFENIVIWEDYRNGNADIYGYNISTHEEFQIATDPTDQKDPAAVHGSEAKILTCRGYLQSQ